MYVNSNGTCFWLYYLAISKSPVWSPAVCLKSSNSTDYKWVVLTFQIPARYPNAYYSVTI